MTSEQSSASATSVHQPVAHAPGAVADAAREARAAPVHPVARRVPVERQPVLARDRVVDRGAELVHALDRVVPAVPAEAHPVGVAVDKAEDTFHRSAEHQGVRAVLTDIAHQPVLVVTARILADVQVDVRRTAAGEFHGLVEGERHLDHLVPVERRPVARHRGDLRVDQRRRRLHLEDRREAVEMALLRGCPRGARARIDPGEQIQSRQSCHALAGIGVVRAPAVPQGIGEVVLDFLRSVVLATRPDSIVPRRQRPVLPDPGIAAAVPTAVVEVRVVVGDLCAPHPVDGLAGAVAVLVGVGVVSGVIVPGARQRIELIAEPVEVGMAVPGRRAHGAVVVADVLRSAVARVLRDEHQPEGVASHEAVRRQAPGERHVLLRRRRKRQERERAKPEQQRRRRSGKRPDTGERHAPARRAGNAPHPAEPG